MRNQLLSLVFFVIVFVGVIIAISIELVEEKTEEVRYLEHQIYEYDEAIRALDRILSELPYDDERESRVFLLTEERRSYVFQRNLLQAKRDRLLLR